MKKILFLILALNIHGVHAQDSDSLYYRNKRLKWVEEYETKYDEKVRFIYNVNETEKEISLEDYLGMPHEGIYQVIALTPDDKEDKGLFFYILNKKAEKTTGPCYTDTTRFYISGGRPPQFKQGSDSLIHYIYAHRQIPPHLYDININAYVYVHCYIDETGHLQGCELEKMEIIGPIDAEIRFRRRYIDKTEVIRETKIFSPDYIERLDLMGKEALRLVNEMPDFVPGTYCLNPVNYRITLKIPFIDNPNYLEYYGGMYRIVK